MAVVPVEEWQRIKASLSQREREQEERKAAVERRQERKLMSQSIVKHWENTIEVGVAVCWCIHSTDVHFLC